ALSSETEPTATSASFAVTATAPSEPTSTATTTPQPTATATNPPTATATTTPQPTATATIAAGSVPSLANQTLPQAQELVGDRWPLSVVEEFSSSVSNGVVIRQDPPPGTSWPLGDPITVVVSLGTQVVAIPDVRGETAAAAAAALEDLGFVVATAEEGSETVPEGVVIRSEPSTEAPASSTVTLIVSSGPSEIAIVPYVYGEDVEEAVETLEEAGFVVTQAVGLSCDRIHEFDPDFDCDAHPDEGVVTSTLAWGSEWPVGTAINITFYDDDL
ncbi:MAG: PASTA domain-containing protein, partial [Vicinamibacterales bacterium]